MHGSSVISSVLSLRRLLLRCILGNQNPLLLPPALDPSRSKIRSCRNDERGVEYSTPLDDICILRIFMHMRTTLIIDEALLQRARELSGIQEKTALVHAGLRALIACEAARRLSSLAGSEPRIKAIPRRRSRPTR